MTEVASAWVELKPSAKGFGTATVRQVGTETEKSGRSLGSKFGSALKFGAIAAVGGGVIAGRFLAGAVQQASDLNETLSKTEVIFGKATPALRKFARTGATELGQTQQQVLDAAATFGTFGQAAGLQDRPLAKFSRGLVTLSTDLASFFNTDPTQAADAIASALRGESEPIRQFGVLLDEATLKAEAMRLGLLKPVRDKSKIIAAQVAVETAQRNLNTAIKEHGKGSLEARKAEAALGTSRTSLKKATEGTIGPLTQQQKVLAAQSSIMRQTKNAQGDFSRTSGGLANQQRILSASFDNLKTRVGKLFLPIVTRVVKFLNAEAVPVVKRFVGGLSSGEGAGGKFAAVMSAIGGALASIDFSAIGSGIKNLDWGKLAEGFKSIDWGAVKDALGSGLNDTLSVFGVLIGFAADHVDTLAKYLPLLITAYIAYKSAAALANLVDLIRIPLLIAQVVTNRAAMKSNVALTTALRAQAGATVTATTAEKVSLITRLRTTVATIASTIAQKAAAAATKAWAAVQWLLNAALTANPLGLIILLVVGLVAAFIIAWKKSDTFRAIVTGAFQKIAEVAGKVFGWLKKAVVAVIGFVKNHWKTIVAIIGGPLAWVVLLVVKHWGRIKAFVSAAVQAVIGFVKAMGRGFLIAIDFVKRMVTGVKEKFGNAVEFVSGIPGKILDALGDVGSMLYDAGRDIIQGLIDGIGDMVDKVKDKVGEVADAIGGFLPGSPVREGPLKSWNKGGAGKRLVGLLADGLSHTSPVEAAARGLASKVRVGNLDTTDPAAGGGSLAGATARGGVQIHVDKVEPHDYRAFLGDLQRRTQRVALGGFT